MSILVLQVFSGLEIDFGKLFRLRTNNIVDSELVNWLPAEHYLANIDMDIVKLTYTKIFNQFNNIIMIGPVSRSGQRMQNSVNYLLEGRLWAVFNLLVHLYPATISPNGSLNFVIRKNTPGYVHLISTLESMLFRKHKLNSTIILPSVKTILWDHQKDSVNKILNGFKNGHYGFGDASSVGSGKTLTALQIATSLANDYNNGIHSGILVLLPGNKLIQTWKDELHKHTSNFDIIFQTNNNDVGSVGRSTIVVTTMARNRDHPINHKWLLVIIDECLTVQNKNALWTQSAWEQSLMAKHLIMMSATLFRARFDKLYYMLKMLRTGLPEQREYLDVILLESIVSQVSAIRRNWISNFNYFELDKITRGKYDIINQSNLSTEAKFSKLSSLLISSDSANNIIIKQLSALLNRLEKKGRNCLMYARSKSEAEMWSGALNIPIYPKKVHHCIVTYHDGTYGLNDLVKYNTIIMRPPPSDTLPQIKGRLDRHGQKSDNLNIEYFVLKNTIEEGLIIRLNIASQFIHNYIRGMI